MRQDTPIKNIKNHIIPHNNLDWKTEKQQSNNTRVTYTLQ